MGERCNRAPLLDLNQGHCDSCSASSSMGMRYSTNFLLCILQTNLLAGLCVIMQHHYYCVGRVTLHTFTQRVKAQMFGLFTACNHPFPQMDIVFVNVDVQQSLACSTMQE